MKYHIDKTIRKTTYIQLYEQLKQDIIANIYPYGTKLPSKRLLAVELGISVVPIEHAYELLREEGYVEARERSGYFSIYRQSDFHIYPEINSSTTFENTHTHTSNNEFPYSVLAKTMRKVILDYNDVLLSKSPNHGVHSFRLAICSYLKRSNGIKVEPRQIIIGSGAEYLYSLIVQLLGNQRLFAIENPSYEKIRRVYNANGLCIDMLKMGIDGIKTSELQRTKASVLHITPFNSFPSGITASASKRYEYIKWAEERNGFIIEDNYDSELTISKKNDDTVFSLARQHSVIYLNTFTKTIAPSIRVGYMILPENLLEEFEEKLGFYSCTVPVFEQYLITELINNGDFERHINRIRRKKRQKKL